MFNIKERQIKGVAFDLEGTIVNLEPLHFAAHLEAARQIGVTIDLDNPKTFTELFPNFIGGPDKIVMEQIWKVAREYADDSKLLSVDELAEIDKEYYRSLLHDVADISPREGFMKVYEEIRRLGVPVAIGSLTPRLDAETILEKSDLVKLFPKDHIILAENVRELKPHPEVYQRTAESMGIDPMEQLVFEDSHNGVRAARAAGSIVIGVPIFDDESIIKRLRDEGAYAVYTDWRNIDTLNLFSKEGTVKGKEL